MKPIHSLRKFLALTGISLLAISSASAQLYWDQNAAVAGAGATPTGTWGTSNFWNTDSLGGAGTFTTATVNTDNLFFVAAPGAASGNNSYVVTVNGAQVANSLTFQASGLTTISGGTSITLGNGTAGAGGISVNQFAYGAVAQGAVNISTALSLANSQTWTTDSQTNFGVGNGSLHLNGGLNLGAHTLTIGGTGITSFNNATPFITGTGGITKIGTGQLILSGGGTASAHNYSGTTTINGGSVLIQNGNNSTGTGNVTINGGVLQYYFGGSYTRTQGAGAGLIQITGGVSGFSGQGGTGTTFNIGNVTWGSGTFAPTEFVLQTSTANTNGNSAFSSNIDLNGADRTIRSDQNSGLTGNGTFSGVISNSSGTAGLIKTGLGHHTLSNTNTYNGATTINQGFLTATVLANGGANSSIGNSSNAASNLVLGNGTTFRYNGAAISTNRSFTVNGTLAGHGASLDASGSGAVNWTNTASPAYGTADQTRTLTLTGTNTGANTLAANLANNGTGAVSLTKSGVGNWHLSGTNVYTGVTTISGGALVLNNANALNGGIGTSGGLSALTFNGGVLGLGTGNFTRSLGSAGTSTAVNFTGAGGWAAYTADRLVNLGGATAQVTWATADTGFNGQTLILSNVSATHKVTLENGLNLGTGARVVQVDNGTASVDGELSGVITGTAATGTIALDKTGAGTLQLSNANSYTGQTRITGGVLLLSNTTALPGGIATAGGTSGLTFNGGVLGLGDGNFTRSLGTAGTATAANFAGAGGWAAFGADRIVNLGGSGGTIVWGTSGTGFNSQIVTLATSNATNTLDFQNALDLGNATRTLVVSNGSATVDSVISGNISGVSGGVFSKDGDGTLALSGTNNYSGNTNLTANGTTGRLIFRGSQSLSSNTSIVFNQNSSLVQSVSFLDDGTGTINFNRPLSLTGTNTSQVMNIFVGNNNTANGGSSTGTTTGSTIQVGAITHTGIAADTSSFTINATGANNYRLRTGTITLNNITSRTAADTLTTILNPTSANMTVDAITMATGNVFANDGIPVLRLDGTSADNIVSGVISNATDFATGRALSLQKTNSSTWSLSGANTYSGGTTLTAGTLNLNNAGSGGTSSAIGTGAFSINGGTIDNTTISAITLSTNNAVTFGGNFAFGGTRDVTFGNGAITNAGNRTITLNGTTSTLTFGGIMTNTSNAVQTTTVDGAGNTLVLGGYALSDNLTSRINIIQGTGNTSITGTVSNGGTATASGLTKTGTGVLTLSGANTYNGVTTVQQGTLIAGTDSLVSTNGAFGNANTVINVGVANTNVNASVLTGGAFQIGRNFQVLSQDGTDVGTRVVTFGGNTAHASTFSGNIILGTTAQATKGISLTAALGGSTTFSGIISNPTGQSAGELSAAAAGIAITKVGLGTVILTNNSNTYTGATNVNQGTLIVNGNISTSILTTVASGATIGGSGTVGALTVQSGGFINPGNSPGILNTGNYTQAGTYTAEIQGLVAGNSIGNHDQINVTGTVNIMGGSLTTMFSTFTPVLNDLVFILLNDGTDAITGTYNGFAQGAVVSTYGGFDWIISYNAHSGLNTFTGSPNGNDIALMAVPEPSVALLGAIGGLLLLRRRR